MDIWEFMTALKVLTLGQKLTRMQKSIDNVCRSSKFLVFNVFLRLDYKMCKAGIRTPDP